jgi:hypothetical protein
MIAYKSTQSLFLFISLLAGPEEAIKNDSFQITKENRGAVISWLLKEELIDPKEIKYILTLDDKLDSAYFDVILLNKRYHELFAQNAPKLIEANRFLYTHKQINEILTFNRAFRQTLVNRQNIEFDRATFYRKVIAETDELYNIWDALRDSKAEFYYITVRRNALFNLKNKLGDEAYYQGTMPPFVPIWRFEER